MSALDLRAMIQGEASFRLLVAFMQLGQKAIQDLKPRGMLGVRATDKR